MFHDHDRDNWNTPSVLEMISFLLLLAVMLVWDGIRWVLRKRA